ncbi:hypothetical protein [Pelagibacterium lentulum]|nr:hypothetical protein [Pelagibacterium lentulum]
MSDNQIAYLLDPEIATIRKVQLSTVNFYKSIKLALGHDVVDCTKFDEKHLIFFDDNGLKEGITHYVSIKSLPDPYVGKIIFAAGNIEWTAPKISMSDILKRLTCYHSVLDPIVETSARTHGNVTSYISAVAGFKARIVPFEIKIQ